MNMEGYVYTDEVIIEITIDGFNGAKGEQGEPGYTPVKGVDYFTEADIAEVVIRTDVEVLAVIQPRLDEINTKLDVVDDKATNAINNLIAEGITRESEDLKLDKKISNVADELGYLDEFVNEGFSAQDKNHVSYVVHQFKDDGRKQIARENIDAASVADIQRVESALADKADKSDIPTVDVNKAYVDAGLSAKQDKLVAGDNIIIEGNKISATGGGGTGDVTKEYLEENYYDKPFINNWDTLVVNPSYEEVNILEEADVNALIDAKINALDARGVSY